MPKETPAQRKIVDRVLHEFKHGELESGRDGKAGKVKSPGQAIAIALSEAGVSNRKPPKQNVKAQRRTRAENAKGGMAQQQDEGRSAPGRNRADLYAEAKRRDIPNRSRMSKAELEKALS